MCKRTRPDARFHGITLQLFLYSFVKSSLRWRAGANNEKQIGRVMSRSVTPSDASGVLPRILRRVFFHQTHHNLIALLEILNIFRRGERQDSPDLCL